MNPINISRSWSSIMPNLGKQTARGVILGAQIAVLLLAGFMGYTLRTGGGIVFDILFGLVFGTLLMAVVALVLKTILRLFGAPRGQSRVWIIIGVLVTTCLLLPFGISMVLGLPLGAALVLSLSALGAVLAALLSGEFRNSTWMGRLAISGLLLFGIVTVAGLAALLAWQGPNADSLSVATPTLSGIESLDPSQPGPYQVHTLTYGSGSRHRPEFDQQANLRTQPVDITDLASVSGFNAKVRRNYWGFDLDQAPLNGHAWLPDNTSDGPFPLILIVHGNDYMTDLADTGYDYLGELLASRGFIAVSIDENFLNTFVTGQLSGEIDARAWLLLEHIQQWSRWNMDPNSPLFGLVDMENLALIGHSRGGEAVAHAAAFATLTVSPDNAEENFDFPFRIRSVIAIAPSDGIYKPADRGTPLLDVNYLVLQGNYDADISTFSGMRQFQRIDFSPGSDYFKSAIYIYRANHSQFNTARGRYDWGLPKAWLLNIRSVLSPEEQRRIAQVFISAFLETTLHDNAIYRSVFQDQRMVRPWLPDTVYISRYGDGHTTLLSDYEEDIDLLSATLPSVQLGAKDLVRLSEGVLRNRHGISQNNHVVFLTWEDGRGTYQLDLPPDFATQFGIDRASNLVFDLANLSEWTPDKIPLDLTIELVDASGESAQLSLSNYVGIYPKLPARFTKWPLWERELYSAPSEPVLQTVSIPLADFTVANPSFDLELVNSARWIFDQNPEGKLALDRIGFRR
ncbi:MAG: hypothetical protein JSV61_08060 [Anaerolineales bacterium]|nr:MAG: hypothetical protein JSV61_08060 [Anaerolineales bacterium]